MHANRILSAPRAAATSAITLTALALALTFAGCKKPTPAAPVDDASLSSALQSRLAADNALSTEPIQASVQNSVATLNGAVSSDAARSLAASDAAQVAGIKIVVNNLTVQL
ncbi:MAG TPA: BON domain-containing protein, partial [Edaphobacter sp.]|nr:BON domain-containing protein [Edaphobacter sp.]